MLKERTAHALSPEETLRAIFAQAFAGHAVHLPSGGTATALRAAMELDPAIIAAIFQDARALARPELMVFAAEEVVAKRRPRWAYILIGLVVAVLVVVGVLWPRQVSTDRLYVQAVTHKAAFRRLAKRAAHGDTVAAFDVGTLLDSGLLARETVALKNNAAAVLWYQMAAARGFAPAETNLAFAYQAGRGVALNNAMAAHWFGLAANAGFAGAQNSLGNMYQYGLGVPRNGVLAVQWYKKAAAQGLALAENNLGAAYELGFGAAQSDALATWWFARAAAQGEPDAAERLGFLYYKGLGVSQSDAQAFTGLEKRRRKGWHPLRSISGCSIHMGAA